MPRVTMGEFLAAWEQCQTPSGRHDREKAGYGVLLVTCPLHNDSQPSLQVSEGEDGTLLLKCFGACGEASVYQPALRAVGLWQEEARANGSRPAETVYPYRSEEGRLLFEVVRGADKGFRQRRGLDTQGRPIWGLGDVRRVLFGLPELLKTGPGDLICLCEGEKDALNVAHEGIAATTNPMGAGKWRQEYTDWLKQHLADRRFLIVPDNDAAGLAHADEVLQSLKRAGLNVQVANLPGLPPKGDITDWLRAGGTPAQLRQLAEPAPPVMALKLLSREALLLQANPFWQVENLFYEESLVELFGPTNQGKTFLAVDVSLSITRGGAWRDHPILKPGAVLYVNADGGRSFKNRVAAWMEAFGPEASYEFHTYPEPVSLFRADQVNELMALLRWLEERPALVVFDTLSRCIPGVNENLQEPMSAVVDHLTRIKVEFGCALMLLHHSDKSGQHDRGSSVVGGAADTIIRVDQDEAGLITATCEKQRDWDKFLPLCFRLQKAESVPSAFLVRMNVEPGMPRQSVARDAREELVLNLLRHCDTGLTQEEIRHRTPGYSKGSVSRYLISLHDQGLVLIDDSGLSDFPRRPAHYYYRPDAE